jgi:hypothetical protein
MLQMQTAPSAPASVKAAPPEVEAEAAEDKPAAAKPAAKRAAAPKTK